ncbi:MAG: CHAT domain-containing protein [Cyanobacteria bacterium J06621_11]
MTRFAPPVTNSPLPKVPDTTVVLHIRSGSFDIGFQVILKILEDNKIVYEEDSFRLPAAPKMRAIYQQWQSHLGEGSRRRQSRLSPVAAQATHISDAEHLQAWKIATKALRDYCQQWFSDREFNLIKKDIINNTHNRSQGSQKNHRSRSIPIVIRCEESPERDILYRIPYQLWSLHTELSNCEFALFNKPRRPGNPLGAKIRVLAIFGSEAGGLRLDKDAAALEHLASSGAQITKVSEPSNAELDTLLADHVWDVLFFAGHSASTCEGGRIQIRKDESLSLENLRPSLAYTLSKGLKLAIFNSCDGLGIAEFLSQLGVPNIIVMKEPVPDDIAGLFLTEFLKEFTKGTQLCQSIRRARQRIALDQEAFPAASWLPIAFLNPNAPELALPVQRDPVSGDPISGDPISEELISTDKETSVVETEFIPDVTEPQENSSIAASQSTTAQVQPSQSGSSQSDITLPVASSDISSVDPAIQQTPSLSSPDKSLSNGNNWKLIGPPILVALLLWVGLAFAFARRCQLLPSAFEACAQSELAPFISEGDRIVENSNIQLTDDYRVLKAEGTESYAAGNYAEAASYFETLRQTANQNRNLPAGRAKALAALQDPESLIYQSNAQARANAAVGKGSSKVYRIAIAAPLDTNSGLDIARGAAQAQAEWLAKGLNLVVVLTNDNNQPTQARNIAEQISSEQDILAVVGHYTSPNTCEALRAYSPRSTPTRGSTLPEAQPKPKLNGWPKA